MWYTVKLTTAARQCLLPLLLLVVVPGARAQHTHRDTLVGTIQSWDAQQGELKLLTGVGMALRGTTFLVPAGTPATEAGSPLSLAALRAGDVIRLVGGSHEEHTAYSIERLFRAGSRP